MIPFWRSRCGVFARGARWVLSARLPEMKSNSESSLGQTNSPVWPGASVLGWTMAKTKRHEFPRRHRLRPRAELLDERVLLSPFVVSKTDDSGPGSLRQAILDADAG